MADLAPVAPVERYFSRQNLTMDGVYGSGLAKIMVRPGVVDAGLALSLGCALPLPGKLSRNTMLTCITVAPNEWLIQVDAEATLAAVLDRVRSALPSDRSLIIDISDAAAVIQLSGLDAAATLASICPLDLSPAAFPAGASARTMIGDVAGVITHPGSNPIFRLIVDQSAADYVWRLLAASAGCDSDKISA